MDTDWERVAKSASAACLVVAAVGFRCAAVEATVLSSLSRDLDRNGVVERVSITCERFENGHPMGGEIVVSRETGRKERVLWRQRKLNPWKLDIGDVDGDAKSEVVVGVWKKSRYDPVFAKRVFVYSWNGKRLLPKWLGSRLSRRFTDFVLCPLDGDGKTELVAMEEAPRAGKYLTVYRWNAFGFDWVGRAGPIRDVKSIRAQPGRVAAETKRAAYSLKLVKGQVKVTRISEAKGEKRIRQ